jgi:hypothetical protein
MDNSIIQMPLSFSYGALLWMLCAITTLLSVVLLVHSFLFFTALFGCFGRLQHVHSSIVVLVVLLLQCNGQSVHSTCIAHISRVLQLFICRFRVLVLVLHCSFCPLYSCSTLAEPFLTVHSCSLPCAGCSLSLSHTIQDVHVFVPCKKGLSSRL